MLLLPPPALSLSLLAEDAVITHLFNLAASKE